VAARRSCTGWLRFPLHAPYLFVTPSVKGPLIGDGRLNAPFGRGNVHGMLVHEPLLARVYPAVTVT